MKQIKYLNPFGRMCVSMGMIPSTYKESLTYEEQLLWLINYLENTVIPAVNGNAEATEELQKYYQELKQYVDEYFDNLDVQEEINNKLDDMAEQGQLADIIAQYLTLSGVIGFHTLNDLKNAENLVNGSMCKTFGKTTYNDGYGENYLIRTLINTDVVDNYNLVALTNFPSLVAERQITNPKKVIMIGDSYANRDNSWQDRVKSYANLSDSNCVMKRTSGVGFVNTQGGVNFITMLTDNISIPAKEVTDIIVCGGYNDSGATEEQLFTALNTFLTTCKNTYPNAEVYVGFISWTTNKNQYYNSSLLDNLIKVKDIYSRCGYWYNKAHYLNNVEYSLHNMNLLDDTYFHPTERGQLELALNITRAWITGSTNQNPNKKNITSTLVLNTEDGVTSFSGNLYGSISNNTSRLFSESTFGLTYDETTSISLADDITIGELTDGYIFGRGYTCRCTTTAVINTKNTGYFMVPAMVWIENGVLKLRCKVLNRTGDNWLTDALKYIQLFNINIICDSMQQM